MFRKRTLKTWNLLQLILFRMFSPPKTLLSLPDVSLVIVIFRDRTHDVQWEIWNAKWVEYWPKKWGKNRILFLKGTRTSLCPSFCLQLNIQRITQTLVKHSSVRIPLVNDINWGWCTTVTQILITWLQYRSRSIYSICYWQNNYSASPPYQFR